MPFTPLHSTWESSLYGQLQFRVVISPLGEFPFTVPSTNWLKALSSQCPEAPIEQSILRLSIDLSISISVPSGNITSLSAWYAPEVDYVNAVLGCLLSENNSEHGTPLFPLAGGYLMTPSGQYCNIQPNRVIGFSIVTCYHGFPLPTSECFQRTILQPALKEDIMISVSPEISTLSQIDLFGSCQIPFLFP